MNIDYDRLFHSLPGLYMILSPDFRIVTVTDSYAKATMVDRKKVGGKPLFEVFPDNPNDPTATGVAQLKASLNRVLKAKSRDVMAIQKYDVRRPDGTFEERHWAPANNPVLDERGEIVYIVHEVEDVTEFIILKRDQLEQHKIASQLQTEVDHLEKMRQSQRMEAMGQLAGGVAHDFNNILATIMIVCEKSMQEPGVPPAVTESLQIIHQDSERAAMLTRQLLAFSRKQVLQPKVLNLNSVVQNLSGLLKRTLNETIDLTINQEPKLWNALIDPGQIEQILINLTVNARDAMPKGGKIIIRTENVVLDQAMSSGHMSVKPGSFVMLSVADTGVGMDAKTQARIFEPFFTTKGAGRGTGLGLATVYGIVEQNKGTIWVYSEPYKGTVFKIYLPRAEGLADATGMAQNSQPIKAIGKQKTILVAEDEKNLRAAIVGILEKTGYKVLEAHNGNHALKTLDECGFKVDLIVSDVVMPEMGGQALAKELAARNCNIKMLYLSGYTEDVLEVHEMAGHSHFLEKPFQMRVLLEKIAKILAGT